MHQSVCSCIYPEKDDVFTGHNLFHDNLTVGETVYIPWSYTLFIEEAGSESISEQNENKETSNVHYSIITRKYKFEG